MTDHVIFLVFIQKKLTKEIFNVTCTVCKNSFKSTRKEEEFCSTNCGIEQFKLGTRKNSLPVGFKSGTLNDHLLVVLRKDKSKKKAINLKVESKAITKEKLKIKVATDTTCKSVAALANKYKISQAKVRYILTEYGVDKFKRKPRVEYKKTCDTCENVFSTFFKNQIFCKSKCVRHKNRKCPNADVLSNLLKTSTLQDIGNTYKVTREAVRQWAVEHFGKSWKVALRKPSLAEGTDGYKKETGIQNNSSVILDTNN